MHTSLRQRMKGQAPHLISLEESRVYILQVGSVLAMLHEQQIVYRNLKPENIFFVEEGKIVLSGPGFITPALLPTTSSGDKNIYRAPEQALGIASRRSDQYALGCIAYELLTGTTPTSASDAQVARQSPSSTPVLPSQLNPALPVQINDVLLKAIATDPLARYDSIWQFLQVFDAALALPELNYPRSLDTSEAPIVASPPPTPQTAPVDAPARQETPVKTTLAALWESASAVTVVMPKRTRKFHIPRPVALLLGLLVLVVLGAFGLTPLLRGKQAARQVTSSSGIIVARNSMGTPITNASGVPVLPTPTATHAPKPSPTFAPTGAASPQPIPTQVAPTATAQLLASVGAPPGVVNLTNEGTTDWVQWGKQGSGDFMTRKQGVAAQISGYTLLGNSTVNNYGNNAIGFSWRDGIPITAVRQATFGIATYNGNDGFQISVPASTTQQTLRVYVGISAATCRFTASLSGNAPMSYTDTSLQSPNFNADNGVYTLTFRASTANQTLTVSVIEFNNLNAGMMTLQAATLQ